MSSIWYKDVYNFITDKNFIDFVPLSSMNLVEKLNAIMRFSIYFSLLIYIINQKFSIVIVPILTAIITYLLYTNHRYNRLADKQLYEGMGLREEGNTVCQKPSKDNPFMNVLMSDYALRPNRPRACKHSNKVKVEMKQHFDHNLYRDIDDIYHSISSDRQFYTTPSTTIPNDSVGFAKFLFKIGKTCKEGSGDQCNANMFKFFN